jgi:nucleotide-binding universal stress UspA family protein
MNETVMLAVDSKHPVEAAAEAAGRLGRDSGDQVVVLHVHEVAVGRFGRIRVCCPEGEGERLISATVDHFKQAGIAAGTDIRETLYRHVAREILAAADEHDARILVLGSSNRTDLPHIPLGSVSHRLLHLAQRPVLIVPRQAAAPDRDQPSMASAG